MNSKILMLILVVSSLVACAPAPTPASVSVPTVTRIPTLTPYPTSTFTNIATSIPTFTPVVLSATDSSRSADSYYQSASAIIQANKPVGSIDMYISKLNLALKDIDTAISLSPDKGDYYILRQDIYDLLTGTVEYVVDYQYLSSLALDNANTAYELGTTTEYPDRRIINELIATDQCEKALSSVQKLIAELPSGDSSLGGLLHIRSRAYACLGRLDDALQSLNDSMFNNINMEYKNGLKAQYLILLERYDEALPILDEKICNCKLSGWHHYLRAEIYYNTGKKNLVQDELFTGMTKTWGRAGMLTYVEAQLALDEGNTDTAIQFLQIAEATLTDPIYKSLRWKIQKQLKTLGAKPLTVTLSVSYPATPIP